MGVLKKNETKNFIHWAFVWHKTCLFYIHVEYTKQIKIYMTEFDNIP